MAISYPIESGYGSFDIKPFPAVLHLINEVNKSWKNLGNKPVGLSKEEYRLFALSLQTQNDIQSAVEQIIQFRQQSKSIFGKERSDFMDSFMRQRVIRIFGYTNEEILRKHTGNLKDYADSSLRYFRTSGLIALRGSGRYVDIALDRKAEVDSVIKTLSLASIDFSSDEDYMEYLGDLSYDFPWQNETDLRNISENLASVLELESEEVFQSFDPSELEDKTLSQQVTLLKDKINDVRIEKLRSLKHNLVALDEAIDKLTNITSSRYETVTARPSLDFEWYASRALMVLNDAIRIEPSFKVGDDGLPTGFRGNISDIECEYDTFGMTIEVTLLNGRDQWYAEGQPVMRHLRDFEDKLPEDKAAFCIFVAPYVHRDTLNQFWTSNKFAYEGRRQNIIPLTIGEFVDFLRKSREMIESDSLNHSTLKEFLDTIVETVDAHTDSFQWQSTIKEAVAKW